MVANTTARRCMHPPIALSACSITNTTHSSTAERSSWRHQWVSKCRTTCTRSPLLSLYLDELMDNRDPSFEEAWLPGPDGLAFYTRTYPAVGSQPKGVALFVHGFADHIGRHEEDNKAWAAGGFTLFGYDARGFGRTALDEANRSIDSMYGKTSTQQTFQDLAWWIEHVSSQFPDLPIFLVAYSAVRDALLATADIRSCLSRVEVTR